MDPSLVTKLEQPWGSCAVDDETLRAAIMMALEWQSDYWARLAVGWLEQGVPPDSALVAALENLCFKPHSQNIRHRAAAVLRRWARASSA
jgi:hypothetical protein